MNKITLTIIIVLLGRITFCQTGTTDYPSYEKQNYIMSDDEKTFLDTLQYKTFLYFINEVNPVNGLVKDRSASWSPASIAASGFAIPVWAIGIEKNWITREKAVSLTSALLQFLFTSEQSDDTSSTGYKGWYYHYLRMNDGLREWKCELSTVDTGWLLAGIIFARQYFDKENESEKSIRDLAYKIINRVDWKFFQMSSDSKFPYAINFAWTTEKGFHPWGWFGYTEAQLLYILAAGCGMPNSDKAYQTWLKTYEWKESYPGLGHVIFPPLFGHQFTHMFIDMRGVADSYLKEKRIDYFENSRRAVYSQRNFAIENPNERIGYDSLTWGLTACDGPGKQYNFDNKEFYSYAARGAVCSSKFDFDDGTIAPTAAAASIVFAPEIVIPTLMNMKEKYGYEGLWGKYGFVDAFNPTANWIDDAYLGLDQGPIVIMIENYNSGFVWKYFMKDEVIRKGMKMLGFEKLEN
ncbi:MAG: glucoamylase family protein [bacterium]